MGHSENEQKICENYQSCELKSKEGWWGFGATKLRVMVFGYV